MTALLLYQLRAPMASFGDVAPGERRETLNAPGHAALAGCLAAALGLERADPRLVPFSAALAFAVRFDQLGPQVADYHTAQVPAARKGVTWPTRRAELNDDPKALNTILSRRDYRFGCSYTVAAMVRHADQGLATVLDLTTLASALRTPKFALYLGRKSCPLGAPPMPMVVEAPASLHAAFAAFDRRHSDNPCDFRTSVDLGILADDSFIDAGLINSALVSRRIERRDVLASRLNWRFDRRSVPVIPAMNGGPAGTGEEVST